MASPNSTFTEMVTTSLRNHAKKLVDNVTDHNGLLRKLKEGGNIVTDLGGDHLDLDAHVVIGAASLGAGVLLVLVLSAAAVIENGDLQHSQETLRNVVNERGCGSVRWDSSRMRSGINV